MTDRKSVLEMAGEFFGEAAVLTAVFIPLDRILMGEPLTAWSCLAIIGISGGSLAAGVVFERKRKS
jgi:hypothetical protein